MKVPYRLFCGDCLEKMKKIPDNYVDMVMCDPPYGTTACKWDSVIPLTPMWEQLKRIVKLSGAIVLMANQPFTTVLIASNMDMFKYCWIWEKNCPSNISTVKTRPMKYSEDVVVFCVGKSIFNRQMIERSESGKKLIESYQTKGTTFKVSSSDVSNKSKSVISKQVLSSKYDPNLKNPSNIIYFITVRGKTIKEHPTQKPVALMEYLIKTYTNEGNIVLDFAMGSGTTGVACGNLDRKFIGIELSEEYFQIAEKRIQKAYEAPGFRIEC